MPDPAPVLPLCPYLRKKGGDPLTEPSPDHYCLLASSIHLPVSQQQTYCLSGAYEACSRYQRQAGRPLPRYVRGAVPVDVRPATPVPELRPLPWRRPWFLPTLKALLILILFLAFFYLWRVRIAQTPPFRVDRVSIPTVVIQATPTPPPVYLPPTAGPPAW